VGRGEVARCRLGWFCWPGFADPAWLVWGFLGGVYGYGSKGF
jgi:hypothetical protein